MQIDLADITVVSSTRHSDVSCDTCQACCCQLEVMLISDTGVPEYLTQTDEWGTMTMRRLDDGWCAALDRNTFKCTIYQRRPLICRAFETGESDCLEEREKMASPADV